MTDMVAIKRFQGWETFCPKCQKEFYMPYYHARGINLGTDHMCSCGNVFITYPTDEMGNAITEDEVQISNTKMLKIAQEMPNHIIYDKNGDWIGVKE